MSCVVAPQCVHPPAAPAAASIAQAPALTAVAEPSPQIAFAVPVQEPAQIVETSQAVYKGGTAASQGTPSGTGIPAPQQLIFGEGDGRQPAPEYPYRARQEGQQSPVTVRFTVGESGQVLEAEALPSCPFVLLNNAALKVIRERWHFRAGPLRRYDVVIRFELHH